MSKKAQNKNRVTGLTRYCMSCQRNISLKCFENGKSLKQCPHTEDHVYKMYVHVKGTKNSRKTKILNARAKLEAEIEGLQFRKETNENSFEREAMPAVEKRTKSKNTPHLLVHAMARYIGFLNNENVPEHRIELRSRDHIKDVERALEEFVQCLKQNEFDLSTFSVEQINDELMGKLYAYYNSRKFAPITYNKRLSHLTSFMNHYIKTYDKGLENWFEGIGRKPVNTNSEAISSRAEFESLLKIVTSENGVKEYHNETKPTRNVYRPWLADGFKLALQTGRRREEVVNLNFKDVITSDEGIPILIKVEDYKVNRIQHQSDEAGKKFIYVPITQALYQLLFELGYEKYKGTDTYMLAPEIQSNRSRAMCDTLSRGFSHFYEQLNTGRKLTFKSLRKTYITNLSIFMGGNAKSVTGHSDDAVIEKHYLDKQAIAKAAIGFDVFPKEIERQNQLEQIRGNSEINQQKMEVEK